MLRRWTLVTAVIALVALPGYGYAELITFENRSIDRLLLAGPQMEGAFTYRATVGLGWEVITQIGNPPSSLTTFFNGEGANVGDTVEITQTDGGLFAFTAVDFRTILAASSDDVEITGLFGGATVGTLNITGSSVAFQTLASGFADTPIDTLRVRVSGGTGNNALLLDNFNLTPGVPEPASMTMLGIAGLALLGYRFSRRLGNPT